MEIKLKSNRRFIILLSLPFVIIFTLLLIIAIVFEIISPVDFSEVAFLFGVLLSFDMLAILIFLLAKYQKGKSYQFTSNRIQIYDKGKFIDEIDISEVKSMHYYPFRWHYLLTIFFGSLMEGGAWKIHTREKNGTSHEIGFLSEKDAITLQEKLYPEILEIMYDKRKKRSK